MSERVCPECGSTRLSLILVVRSYLDGDTEDEKEAVELHTYMDGYMCLDCHQES